MRDFFRCCDGQAHSGRRRRRPFLLAGHLFRSDEQHDDIGIGTFLLPCTAPDSPAFEIAAVTQGRRHHTC